MALQVIGRDAIPQLLEKLMTQGKVVAPQRREGEKQWAYADVTDAAGVELDYISTILSPKKYAAPQREQLMRYELSDKPMMEAVTESEPITIFGAHPCDIYALRSVDLAYCDGDVDPNWAQRRSQMRTVGVDCVPDEWCFCGSMGTATAAEGFDLFLTPVNGGYLAEVGSDEGAQMLAGLPMRDATAAEVTFVKTRLAEKVQKTSKLNADYHTLPMVLDGGEESETWEQHATRCYSCGTCNLVCPTCFCFDVTDKMNLSLKSGVKQREWDGCMLEGFARIASGENFRHDRPQRLRHRFYRKYSYLFTRYGRPYCCGCGRCVRQCLVHIDPVAILNDMIAEAEGRRS